MQKLKLHFVGHCMGWSVSDLHMSFRQMGHEESSSSAAPPEVSVVAMLAVNSPTYYPCACLLLIGHCESFCS